VREELHWETCEDEGGKPYRSPKRERRSVSLLGEGNTEEEKVLGGCKDRRLKAPGTINERVNLGNEKYTRVNKKRKVKKNSVVRKGVNRRAFEGEKAYSTSQTVSEEDSM